MKERIKVVLYNKTLKEIDMTDFSYIGDDIFAYRDDFVKIILPEGVVEIGGHAFECCTRLEEVVCPRSLAVIAEEAFADCINLKKVECGEHVQIAPSAFKGCINLKR